MAYILKDPPPIRTDQRQFPANSNNFVVHQRTTHAEKPFGCRICKKRFTAKKNMKNHTLVVHENAGSFGCDQCDKTFYAKQMLIAHQTSHTGEKPFICTICQNRYASKTGLCLHHLKYHSENKFQCDQCGMVFEQRVKFRSHCLIVHAEAKPFQCKECPKKFASEGFLKMHICSHTNRLEKKCNQCGVVFKTNSHLKDHSIVHSNKWPWKCEECEKAYKRKSDLNRHLLIHLTNRPIRNRKVQRSVQGEGEFVRKIKASDAGQASHPARQYSLRERREQPNYREDLDELGESSGKVSDTESNDDSESRLAAKNDEMTSASSDECDQDESDHDGDWSESCTVANSSLKLVFDVEYRAPE